MRGFENYNKYLTSCDCQNVTYRTDNYSRVPENTSPRTIITAPFEILENANKINHKMIGDCATKVNGIQLPFSTVSAVGNCFTLLIIIKLEHAAVATHLAVTNRECLGDASGRL